MKIVYVAEWDPLTGGGFTVVSNLIDTILRLNFPIEIHVVSFGEENRTVSHNGYTVHYIKNVDFLTASYWYSHKIIMNKILEINPDLIHLHFTYPPYSFIAQLSIPVIVTVHGLASIRVKGSHSKKDYFSPGFVLNPHFEKKALQNADKIIAVSNWMKNNVENIIGRDPKIIYIPNGVNYEKYTHSKKVKINHPSILFIGRLVKLKGLDLLLKSLHIVKESIPDIHLYVIGQGSQHEKLTSLAVKLNVNNNISFLGFFSGDEKNQFLASADIFVMPSRIENASISLMEALASGIPIVASNVGGIPHILNYGEYGILVEPENPEDLANGIIKLIGDPVLRKELSEKGRKRAQEYSWDEITKKTIELYQSLV